MSNILDQICEDKRLHIAEHKAAAPIGGLVARAARQSAPRGFHGALCSAVSAGRTGLIAEIKKASPSGGLIRANFDPPALARAYEAGGAACLSVLTDTHYFHGEDDFLTAARDAAALPVLRKDFILDPYQVVESRAMGADCILLIMAVLEDGQAAELEAAALEHDMDVLVESHNAQELQRALRLKSLLMGINNRDLTTLTVDLSTTEELVSMIPKGHTIVSESGIGSPGNVARVAAAGAHCILVGESLMRQADVRAATGALLTRENVVAGS
jgi:indole-3-glycerol phosphate synthase